MLFFYGHRQIFLPHVDGYDSEIALQAVIQVPVPVFFPPKYNIGVSPFGKDFNPLFSPW